MPAPTRVPDKEHMQKYLAKGYTHQQIVDAHGAATGEWVSRAAISMAIKRYELESNNARTRYEDMIPWKVRPEHRMHTEARLLRLEARRRRGLPLTERELGWLNGWIEQLREQNAVVTYNADTEDGFYWTPRLATDDDIIRRPDADEGVA